MLVPGLLLFVGALALNGAAFLRGSGSSSGSFTVRAQAREIPHSADPTTHSRDFPARLIYPSLPEIAVRSVSNDHGRIWQFTIPSDLRFTDGEVLESAHLVRAMKRAPSKWVRLEAKTPNGIELELNIPSGSRPPDWLGDPAYRIPGPADFDPVTGAWIDRRKGTSLTRFRLAGVKKGTWLLAERTPREPRTPVELLLIAGPSAFPSADFIEADPPPSRAPTELHAWDDGLRAWVRKGALDTLRFPPGAGIFQDALFQLEPVLGLAPQK